MLFYDLNNRITKDLFTDINRDIVVTTKGISGELYELSDKGDQIKTFYIDKDDNIIDNVYDYASTEREFEDNGGVQKEIYFNKNGVPAELVYRIINNCYINVNFSFALHKPGCVPLKSCKNVTVQPAPFAKTPDGVFPLLRS